MADPPPQFGLVVVGIMGVTTAAVSIGGLLCGVEASIFDGTVVCKGYKVGSFAQQSSMTTVNL